MVQVREEVSHVVGYVFCFIMIVAALTAVGTALVEASEFVRWVVSALTA